MFSSTSERQSAVPTLPPPTTIIFILTSEMYRIYITLFFLKILAIPTANKGLSLIYQS